MSEYPRVSQRSTTKQKQQTANNSRRRRASLQSSFFLTMSELNNTAFENSSDDYPLNNDDVHIHKGGRRPWTERNKLKYVHVHECVVIVLDKAFYKFTNLQTVKFSTKGRKLLKKIGEESFLGCCNLSLINLQDTQVEMIGDRAFSLCGELGTVQLPTTIQKIGRGCFAGCHQLQVVDLSHVNYLESIEEGTFARCSTLTTVNLPRTTSRIGKRSFYWCHALDTLDLRSTCVKEIGEAAFRDCRNLATILLPTTIKSIGTNSFRVCEKLSSLDLQATRIETIGDEAFQYCSSLSTINFPKTLKFIGKYCFNSCTKLKDMNLRDTSVEKIGDCAFYNCNNLTTIVGIPSPQQADEGEREEVMGDETFHYDAHMKLPASLVDIGWNAFSDCPKLKKQIDNNWLHYACDVNRGGGRFLQRHHHHHHENNDSNDDGDAKRRGKVYCSSLWPLILYRAMHEMELPTHSICPNNDYLPLYTNANPVRRRASVVFYLLVHGVIADLQPERSGDGPKHEEHENSFDFQSLDRKKNSNTPQCRMM